MKSRTWIALAFLSLVVPAFSGTALRGDVIIDSFDDPEGPVSCSSGMGGQVNNVMIPQAFPSVLGGRGLSLTNGNATVGIDLTGNTSLLDFSGDSAEFLLAYGGSSGLEPWIPSPMGLRVDPIHDVLRLTFFSYNHAGGLDMQVDTFLETELGQTGISTPISRDLTAAGAQTLDIPLGSLNGTQLDFVTFDFHAPANTQFQLDSVSTLCMLTMAMGLGIVHRKRRK